jgi:peptide/nickel transport system substrate-binding protein
VTIRHVPEPSARVAGLRTGELDLADTIPIDQADGLKSAGFNIIQIDAGNSTGFWIDTVTGDRPRTTPVANKLVRQALNYAIDREPMVKNIYKGYTKVEQGQPIQPETFGYHPNLKPYPFDQAKAKQLLAQAGYANGFKIKAEGLFGQSQESNASILYIQDQLKQVGVELEIVNLAEYAVFRDKFYGVQERGDLFAPGLINTPAMDADFSLVWFWSGQTAGTRHYNNPEFDRWYVASTTEMDETKRKEAIWKALEVFHEDPPWLFALQGTALWAYNGKVKNAERRTDREQRFDRLMIGA